MITWKIPSDNILTFHMRKSPQHYELLKRSDLPNANCSIVDITRSSMGEHLAYTTLDAYGTLNCFEFFFVSLLISYGFGKNNCTCKNRNELLLAMIIKSNNNSNSNDKFIVYCFHIDRIQQAARWNLFHTLQPIAALRW